MSTTPKEMIFEEEAREKLLSGISTLTDVIACTLGPKGRNVGLDKSWGPPAITNDGGNITNDIELADTFENMGVSIAKDVVSKIKEKCGDGTTTGSLLLRALVESGVKNIASGASPISVKRGIEKAVAAVIDEVNAQSTPVKDSASICNIATASASGDQEAGRLIAEAYEKVGHSGVVTIEEAKGTESAIEVVEGMRFDRGYLSPYFCTNTDKMQAELTAPSILVVNKKVDSIHELLPILQTVAASGKELLIIAEDIDGDALSTLVVNKVRGSLKVSAVKAPGFGDSRKAMLEDIAVLTGATVVCEDTGTTLKETTADALGSAERVLITKDSTTLINGSGSAEAIQARVQQITNEENATTSGYEKDKLIERKAKLSGGVALIRVGAITEPELKHKKQLFDDSLSSTKAAIEEGIVIGGGVTLVNASHAVDTLNLQGDELVGGNLVKKACEAPMRQLITNSGEDASVVVAEIKQAEKNTGFNMLTGQIENLQQSGVFDPAKVVKNSLSYAASAAGMVLISEVLMADAEEEDEEA